MAKKDKADISDDLKKSQKSEDCMSAEDKNLEQENAEDMGNADNSNGTKKSDDESNFVVKEEFDALNNKMQRLQADFLNYKARTEKERFSTYSNAVTDVLTDLVPIVDNFERAIDAVKSENEEIINLKSGIKMIYDQFLNILQRIGLKEIEALNSKFDPNIHAGIAFEVIGDKDEDTVIEVFQKGYLVNDKVIRPSMVKVSKLKS
jgi:molecular chaperone GrpE